MYGSRKRVWDVLLTHFHATTVVAKNIRVNGVVAETLLLEIIRKKKGVPCG